MELSAKIYVAGQYGLVGSALAGGCAHPATEPSSSHTSGVGPCRLGCGREIFRGRASGLRFLSCSGRWSPGIALTVAEIAELIAEVVGYRGSLNLDGTKPDGTPQKLLNVSRLSALGWRATVDLRERLAATHHHFGSQTFDGRAEMVLSSHQD